MVKDLFELYKLYLFALKTREEYGDLYGDTEEIIEMYEKQLEEAGVIINKERSIKKVKK